MRRTDRSLECFGRPTRGLKRIRLAIYVAALCPATGYAAGPAPPASGNAVELDEFRVQGNTVLGAAEIEQAVYPYLGPNKTAADVEQARAALAALYHQHGFATVLVTIPPQRVTAGLVILKVVEQLVERLRVVGAHHVEPAVLKRQAPSVAPGRVANLNALKRDVARLNSLPDRSVTPSFRPGRRPDTVDVDLTVQDSSPLHGTLEFNNRRSIDTSVLRLNGSLSYDNFFQRGDTGTIFFQVAPSNTKDARVVGGSYLYHIPDSVLALLVSYTDSASSVSTFGSTTVIGKGQIASVRIEVPLGLEDGFVHSFSFGIDYKRLDEQVGIGALTAGGSSNSFPVTYYPVSLAYEADWVGAKSQTSLNASAVLGLRGQGSDENALFEKRAFASANFAYLRASLSRTQTLPYDMQLYGDLTGQATTNSLVSSEQLSIGGLDSVRGYLEGEALGDQGATLQTEWRSPSLAKYVGSAMDSWRFHAFADIGNVSIHRSLIGQASSYTLGSAGVGTRVALFGYLSATLEDAFLLSRGPNSKSGSNRVLFRISGRF